MLQAQYTLIFYVLITRLHVSEQKASNIVLITFEFPIYIPALLKSSSRSCGRGCKHSFDVIDRRVRKLPLWFGWLWRGSARCGRGGWQRHTRTPSSFN